MIAAAAGNSKALGELLRLGANVNAVDSEGRTALMRAVAVMALNCAELLLPVSNLNARDYAGRRALACAPPFHADPDDPTFEEAMRFSHLLRSLQEAGELEIEVSAPLPKQTRAL